MYLEWGELSVKLLGRGFAWLDTGTHESLYKASEFVKTIEDTHSIKIACIEEIAYRKGYITKKNLYNLAKPLMKNDYGQYLMKLLT